ncbi:MAG: HD domain-containing protein [Clostridia bacterium]|nr:HD domain-containing protein [Clostridia bacterium]
MNSYETDLRLSREIAAAIAEKGGRAYYVGGFVRDALMGAACLDIDIEVYGLDPQILRDSLSGFGEVLDKGASFGILGIAHSNIDIAMPRTESRTGSKHTDFDVCVNPFLDPKEAAKRRDFTVNAMMQDVLTGEILDFYGGREDLKNRVIRCVCPETFVEDALRVFRAAQFAARFEAAIDPATLALCASMDVSDLSFERILGETEKALLKAGKPSAYFRLLREMNHLREFFPEIEKMADIPQNPKFHPEGDVFEHTMLVLDSAAQLRNRSEWPLSFMLSALFHDIGKIVATEIQEDGRITAYGHEVRGLRLADTALRRITHHEKLVKTVLNHISLHMRPNMLAGAKSKKKKTRQLFDLSLCPNDLILLSRADASGKLDEPYDESYEAWLRERLEDYRQRLEMPMVTGQDLVNAGLKPGKDFSEILQRARQLHFSGIEKKAALRQVVAEARNCRKNSQK